MSDSYTNPPKPVHPSATDPRLQPRPTGSSGFATGFMVAGVFVVVGLLAFAFYSPTDDGAVVQEPAVVQPEAAQPDPAADGAADGAVVDTAPVPNAPAATSDQPANNGVDAIPADPNTGNSSEQDLGAAPAPQTDPAPAPAAPAN